MATRVWESSVIGAPIDTVWALIRPLNFAYTQRVTSAEVEEKKSAAEVGAIVRVTYKDTTVQRLKIVEISDAGYSISWDVVESIPAVSVMASTHTIKLRRVTESPATFIEYTTDFSSDAGLDVTQDARFKQQDHFTALSKAVETAAKAESKGAPAKRVIGGMAGVYNPQKAREGVLQLYAELQSLQTAANGHATVAQPALVELTGRYKKLPITWVPNWAVADLSPENAQRIADDVRTKLNTARSRLGDNGLPLPRLFNAQ
jgi:hypothetical protein